MPEREDEFYVGYLPQAPRGVSSRSRLATFVILTVAALLAMMLVAAQRPFARSSFEFGVAREFAGVIRERPHPMLQVLRPGSAGEDFSQYYLVAYGKVGADELVTGRDGQTVSLRGSLIYRDGVTMIEVAEGSVEPVAAPGLGVPRIVGADLGTMTLVGEIVDSKCFLGVMKPGNSKPHRACAARCISGGIPPVLLVRDKQGNPTYFLLVSSAGESVNDAVIDLVAEPVEITGRVMRHGDLLVLHADPETYRRI